MLLMSWKKLNSISPGSWIDILHHAASHEWKADVGRERFLIGVGLRPLEFLFRSFGKKRGDVVEKIRLHCPSDAWRKVSSTKPKFGLMAPFREAFDFLIVELKSALLVVVVSPVATALGKGTF